MDLKVGVKVCLKNKKGKYLLLRRNDKKYTNIPSKGTWDVIGGKIVVGTSLYENLKREIKEETGAKWEGKIILLHAQDVIIPNEMHVVRLTYFSELTEDLDINLDKSENVEYGWFSLQELKELAALDRFVKEVVELGLLQ